MGIRLLRTRRTNIIEGHLDLFERYDGAKRSATTRMKPDPSMKPTAPPRNKFSVFVTTPCRRYSCLVRPMCVVCLIVAFSIVSSCLAGTRRSSFVVICGLKGRRWRRRRIRFRRGSRILPQQGPFRFDLVGIAASVLQSLSPRRHGHRIHRPGAILLLARRWEERACPRCGSADIRIHPDRIFYD